MPVADFWKQLGDMIKLVNMIFGIVNIVFIIALPKIWGSLKNWVLEVAKKSSSDSVNSMREELRKDMNAIIGKQSDMLRDHDNRLIALETGFEISIKSVIDRTLEISSHINEMKIDINTQFKSIYTLIIERLPKNQ